MVWRQFARVASVTSLIFLIQTNGPGAMADDEASTNVGRRILASSASPPTARGVRVFAHLVVAKSLRTGSIHSYLFPVFLHERGRYRSARMQGPPVAGDYGFKRVAQPPKEIDARASILNRVKQFTLYDSGIRTGHYYVERLEVIAPSGCSTELTGVGRPSWITVPDFQRGEPSYVNKNEEARLLGFFAVSGITAQHVRPIKPSALSAREKEFLTVIARKRLERWAGYAPRGTLKLKKAFRFDIDLDDKLEIAAMFAIPVTPPSDCEHSCFDELHIPVVARTRPRLMNLNLPDDVEPVEIDALGVIDVDGDGRAELLFGYGPPSGTNFDVYSSAKGGYQGVFREGRRYGC